ncbi:hypothetical protein [Bacillus horti]|uniref:Uncharacterized protein n=1 Tax=Caldalkalibacillus horti TaxID=77523 RepID=A0ABT9VTC4_9BACI|nr:hypothetical protein [Bacillus horti]MDQ0164230.1 hypothetical protein [Bacillus horti]
MKLFKPLIIIFVLFVLVACQHQSKDQIPSKLEFNEETYENDGTFQSFEGSPSEYYLPSGYRLTGNHSLSGQEVYIQSGNDEIIYVKYEVEQEETRWIPYYKLNNEN